MCHSDPNGIQFDNTFYPFYPDEKLDTDQKNAICDLVDCLSPRVLSCISCPFYTDEDDEEEEED